MGNIPPKFERFIGQRRLRDQSWEWSRVLLVCLAIAVLLFWQLGQVPLTRGEERFVDQAQQWLELLLSAGFNPFEHFGSQRLLSPERK